MLKRDFFNPQVYFESFGGKPTVEERNKIIDLKNVHRSWALDKVQTEYGDYGYGINYRYLRKIVDLCKGNESNYIWLVTLCIMNL